MNQTTRKQYATEIDAAKYGGLTDRQRELLWGILGQCTEPQVRRALNQSAERDRFSFENLLTALRIAAKANQPDDPDKPFHPPACSGGCEGEGWVPGPRAQARMQAANQSVALHRCPAGPEMTQAVWDGIRPTVQAWASEQTIDVAALIADTKITHHLSA